MTSRPQSTPRDTSSDRESSTPNPSKSREMSPDEIAAEAMKPTVSRTLIVICSNGHRKRQIAKWVSKRSEDALVWGRWAREEPRYPRRLPDEPIRHLQKRASEAVLLADEEGERVRFQMTCKLCGIAVAAREENLARILDTLAAHGVQSIELKEVAPRL